jgi:hypothetical protein
MRELKPIDISDVPELIYIVEEVRKTGEPRRLRRSGEDVAILRPIKRPARTRACRCCPTSADDALWKIIGNAEGPDDGTQDVSADKHTYLADAYAASPE